MKFDQHNWQHHAVRAIEQLPEELRDAVGYSRPRGKHFTVTIACDSFDGGETQIKTIQLRGDRPKRVTKGGEAGISRPAFIERMGEMPDWTDSELLSFVDAADFRRSLQLLIAEIIGEHARQYLSSLPQANREVSIEDMRELATNQSDPEKARLLEEMIELQTENQRADLTDEERLEISKKMLNLLGAAARYMS